MTLIIVPGMELLLLGRVTYDYLLTGSVAAFLVAFIVVGILLDTVDELRLAASVFANTQVGIIVTDADNKIINVNPGFTIITGYEREEVLGRNPRILRSPDQEISVYAKMWESLQTTGAWQGELWNLRKSGETYATMLAIRTVADGNGQIRNHVGLFSDISELKAREADLERIAHYDPLTGVPNRRLLVDRLGQAVVRAQRSDEILAVCYLDLDGFKLINDQLGHDAGDILLVKVTKRLQAMLRASDTLARLGGDEFALLLGSVQKADDCSRIVERMLVAIASPFTIKEQSVSISASIGMTIFPFDTADVGSLLRHADQAMYQAKEAGKNRFCLYDSLLNRERQSTRKKRDRLSEALQQQEFVLYYQPKVHLVDGTMVGAEALIRWQHPENGLLAPQEFLPLISDSELEVPIGEWVIDAALQQIGIWQADGLPLRVSVNISATHLQQPNFTERLRTLLEKHKGVSADSLELEILESSAFTNLKQVSHILNACKELGVHFALDDFGTGYSSLSYFRDLPVETLKIDQSFVREMLDNSDDLNIVESVIHLARTLKRSVVAEGIETSAHAEALVKLGCPHGQGYAISRPIPAEAILAWLKRWKDSPGLGLAPVLSKGSPCSGGV